MCQTLFFFAEPAARWTSSYERNEAQTLMDVKFDVPSNANELRRQVKKVQDWKRVVSERTHNELRTEGIQS